MGSRVFLMAGDSFIARLDREIQSRDPQFRPHFQVPGIRVDTYTRGGWKVWDMLAHSGDVKLLDPSFIYFQIGGNDVSTTAPEVLACNIIDAAEFLVSDTGASYGIVGQLLYRDRSAFLPSQQAVLDYNARVDIVNRVMRVLAGESDTIRYWRHKGLMDPAHNILCQDGTHLNQHGLFKFYRSIRGAALLASRGDL